MFIDIAIESEIIDDQKRFTITVNRPEQEKASFIHKNGFHFNSFAFDKMMACVFGLEFDCRRVDKKTLSVGLPGGYRDVRVEEGYEPLKDHKVVVERLNRALVEVAASIDYKASEVYQSSAIRLEL